MISFRKSWACLSFLVLISHLLVPPVESADSEFLTTNWRNENGLPHSIVNCVLQTQDGYLWLGTYVGLVRFDGNRFVHYTANKYPELGAGRIVCLFEDSRGTLWVALENGGLITFSGEQVRVHVADGKDTSATIRAMAEDGKGVVWALLADGNLARVTHKGLERVASTGGAPGRLNLFLLLRDGKGQLWAGTSEGLKLWRNGQLTSIAALTPAMDGPVQAASASPDGAIWIFSRHTLWKINDAGIIDQIDVPAAVNDVLALLASSDGRLWLAAGSGGALYHRDPDGTWGEIPQSAFFGLNRVLFEDHEGNIWRGSFGGGLTRIRPRLFTVHELTEPSVDRYARTLCADQSGNLWAIMNGQMLAQLPAGKALPQLWSGSFSPANIRSLYADRRGTLWAGCSSGRRLYRMQDGKFLPAWEKGLDAEYVSAFFEDSKTNLWVGYTGGAGVAVLPQGDPKHWRPLENMPYPDVRCIAEASDGAMWFGTYYGGVCRWQNGKWTRFTMRDGLPSDYVRCLLPEPDGGVWIGTIDGLCRWKNGKFVSVTLENGLWNNALSSITADGLGNLWLSSFGGVFRVRHAVLNEFADGKRKAIECVGYDRSDGLASIECPGGCQPAAAQTPDGRLWFPTTDGVISVLPRDINENRLPPPVWIESLTVDGVPKTISRELPRLKVAPGQRRFEFRFTALSLTAPEKIRFRHRLLGLDPDWSPADAQRTAAYSYIPPGKYTFQVAACNNDGVWNLDGQSMLLIVPPFYWQTTWFKTAVGLALALILAWGVRLFERWKNRLRLERIKRQHAVERERSRIAKDIHDDLGANLTQIVFLSQRVEGTADDPAEVERWIRKIPATASRTIQSLDEIVWAINPKHDTLESLANYLSRFAQEFLSLAGIRCVLDVPTVLPAVPLSAEVRHNLVLTAREALQNAATHAGATEVRVALQWNDRGLQIAIVDNGNGFDPAQTEHHGNGLMNMRRRLEDVGGTLEILSRPGAGTTVRFKLAHARLHGRVVGRADDAI